MWKIDPEYQLQDDDFSNLKVKDFKKTSSVSSFKPGYFHTFSDIPSQKVFCGRVLGFSKDDEKIMYLETQPGLYVIDFPVYD